MTSRKPPPAIDSLPPNSRVSETPGVGIVDQEQRGNMQNQVESGPSEGEGLDARLQAQIGQKLKLMFDEVANAPVPDKFLNLLSKLDGQEKISLDGQEKSK